jgi:hypothetical protein
MLWLMDIIHIYIPEDLREESFLYPYIVSFAPKIGNYVAAVFPFADNLFDSDPGTCSNRTVLVLLIDNYDSFTYNLADYLLQLGTEIRFTPE